DFHGDHGFAVRDHFHGEVRFAVGDAAAHGRAHAGRVAGIQEVHVQADADTCGIVHGEFEGVSHYLAHAAFVDVAHGEGSHAQLLDEFLFVGIQIAHAHQDDVL